MTETTERRRAKVTLPSDTEILITREFDASASRLYAVWTDPQLVARWYHANRGELTEVTHDLQVGGRWRYAMTVASNGERVAWSGTFLELVPGEKVVRTAVFEPFPDAEAVETATFTEQDGSTLVQLHVQHQNRQNRDLHLQAGMEDGLQDALDLVERLVSADV